MDGKDGTWIIKISEEIPERRGNKCMEGSRKLMCEEGIKRGVNCIFLSWVAQVKRQGRV